MRLLNAIAGLQYAFSETMRRKKRNYPNSHALHDKVSGHEHISVYLASDRGHPELET